MPPLLTSSSDCSQPQCLNFVDPYVEHGLLIVILDLILMKPEVHRHLLFNRGYGIRNAPNTNGRKNKDIVKDSSAFEESAKEWSRLRSITGLGLMSMFVDAYIRWCHLGSSYALSRIHDGTVTAPGSFVRIFIGCLVETLVFHLGVVIACATALKVLDINRIAKTNANASIPYPQSDIRSEFRLSHVPLTLFYSSITKYLLLLILTVWRPAQSTSSVSTPRQVHVLSFCEGQYELGNGKSDSGLFLLCRTLMLFNEDHLDPEWVVQNLLGGMSAGFGLRVVLDMHPVFTVIIIVLGWGVKTLAASLLSSWVSGSEVHSGIFLQYSIP